MGKGKKAGVDREPFSPPCRCDLYRGERKEGEILTIVNAKKISARLKECP